MCVNAREGFREFNIAKRILWPSMYLRRPGLFAHSHSEKIRPGSESCRDLGIWEPSTGSRLGFVVLRGARTCPLGLGRAVEITNFLCQEGAHIGLQPSH